MSDIEDPAEALRQQLTPQSVLDQMRQAFAAHALGDVTTTTQPDGDLEASVVFDRFGARDFIEKMRRDATEQALVAGHDRLPPHLENFLNTMETGLHDLCEGGPVTIDNPAGIMLRRTMEGINNLFGRSGMDPAEQAELDNATTEENMRRSAAQNGQPYVEKLTVTCGIGI